MEVIPTEIGLNLRNLLYRLNKGNLLSDVPAARPTECKDIVGEGEMER